jgi:ribA/ribD-fused uncharacterized protein
MTSTRDSTTFHRNGHDYHVPFRHYSRRVHEALFFYGGDFSNFVGGPWEIRDYNGLVYLMNHYNPDEPVTQQFTAREIAQSTHLREYEALEHYIQANKASGREDHDYIADQLGPRAAKWAGQKRAMDSRGVVIRPDWEEIKYDVLLVGLRVKFADPHYRAVLLSTRDRFIAEDSPSDDIWGIRSRDGGYNGDNLLGKGLMQVRDEIRVES